MRIKLILFILLVWISLSADLTIQGKLTVVDTVTITGNTVFLDMNLFCRNKADTANLAWLNLNSSEHIEFTQPVDLGPIVGATNGGMQQLFNVPVTADAVVGSDQGGYISSGSTIIFKALGDALDAGGIENPRVDIDGNLTVSDTIFAPGTAAATTDTDKFLVLESDGIKYRTGAETLSDIGAASNSWSSLASSILNIGDVDGDDSVTFINVKAAGGTIIEIEDDYSMAFPHVTQTSSDPDKFLVLNSGSQVKYRSGAQVLSDIGGASTTQALDHFGATGDNTDLDATTSAHGLLPKLGGGSENFLRADGTWATPPNDNTWRDIDDTPADGVTTESISSNWAYDHENNASAHGYIFYEDSSLSGGDHTYSGQVSVTALNAGEELVYGEAIYVKSDGTIWKTDADDKTTSICFGIVVADASAEGPVTIIRSGYIRDDSWNWTVGSPVYLSTTAGALTQSEPSGSSDQINPIGIAYHADKIQLNISNKLTAVP